jgi:hypothetical protein
MAITEELLIKLTADNDDLKKKLQGSKSDLSGFGGAVSKLGPMIAGAFSVGAIVAFGKAAFSAYEEQEKANKKLMSSLNGNELAFKQLTTQAEQLRNKTGVDDGAIMQIQQLGAGAGYSVDKIKKLTDASVQLAAKTGQDLQSAYMQINATFTGSAGRLTRLDSDFGLLTETQLKNGEAVDLILNKYGTFAQDTASQTDILKSNFDELTESVGYAFAEGTMNPFLTGLNEAVLLATKLMGTLGPTKIELSGNQSSDLEAFNSAWERQKKSLSNEDWAKTYQKNVKLINDEWNKASDALGAFENKILANENASFFNKQKLTDEGKKQQEQDRLKLEQSILFRKSELQTLEAVNKLRGSKTKIVTPLSADKKEAQLKEFNDLFAEVQAEHDAILIEKKKSLADQLSEDSKYFDNLFADVQKSDDDILRSKKEAANKLSEDTKNAQKDYDLSKLSSYEKEKALIEASLVDAESKAELMKQLEIDTNNAKAESMANMFGQAAAMFKENTIAYKAMATAQIMISTYIAAMAAYADGTKYGGPILGAVYAAIAVAAGLANIAKVNGIAFADGGIVSGPTNALIGEYAGARSNPEVVAPLDKLKGMIGGGRQQVEVVGYISGDVIRLANKRSEYILNRRG